MWVRVPLDTFMKDFIYAICIIIVAVCGPYVGFSMGVASVLPIEQHEHCYDTKTHEGWVAHKNGEIRCFMENRQYPHRVRGSYID